MCGSVTALDGCVQFENLEREAQYDLELFFHEILPSSPKDPFGC
jgi:hypothetical protein